MIAPAPTDDLNVLAPSSTQEDGKIGRGTVDDDLDFETKLADVEVRSSLDCRTSVDKSTKRNSSLKVKTQKDSLTSCGRPKKKTKMEMILSFFYNLEEEEGLNRTRRSSLLMSTHGQKGFRLPSGELNLDDISMGEQELRTIRFFDVEVREYEVTASDNPGVRNGVALELGWKYNVQPRLHIDTFEDIRSKVRSQNFQKEKKLTKLERERLLREFGITPKDMQAASKRAAKIRKARKKSIEMRRHDKFHEKVEDSITKMKKLAPTLSSFRLSKSQSSSIGLNDESTVRRASTILALLNEMDGDFPSEHLLHQKSSLLSSTHSQLNTSQTKSILKTSTLENDFIYEGYQAKSPLVGAQ